jgi:PEP-CTERM motif-containing protein
MKAQNKTIITSNSRPLPRALGTLLLCIAALWAMPASARAQVLFVGHQGDSIVGEYDATSGAAINASFITGVNRPAGLALLGNNLFVANFGSTTVGEYNATTGAAINANFINTGLGGLYGLALSGSNLFVSDNEGFLGTTVGEYSATTGAAINANFITGLGAPTGLALSGNDLFVANFASGTVGEYNATTGAAINANFITGLSEPAGLLVASVPEPSTWSMIAIGGVALLAMLHRRKRRTA